MNGKPMIWVLLSVGDTHIRVCGTTEDAEKAREWTHKSHWHDAVCVPLNDTAVGEIVL